MPAATGVNPHASAPMSAALAAEHDVDTSQHQIELRLAELPDSLGQGRPVQVRYLGHVGHGVAVKSRVGRSKHDVARRLRTLMAAQALDPVPVDGRVADAWARLRVALRDSGLRMSTNDSWIAATAMALGVPVVTQDDDYVDVPELKVIRV